MEQLTSAGGRTCFLGGCLLTFLLLCCNTTAAEEVIEQVSDPTGNVNLSPFQQWKSAYECLLNTSSTCPDKYQLTQEGWLNVTQANTWEYCKKGGCADHTRAVLLCVYQVKPDYRFINAASVEDLNQTITLGCQNGFTGAPIISSAVKTFQSRSSLLFSFAPALFLLAFFHV